MHRDYPSPVVETLTLEVVGEDDSRLVQARFHYLPTDPYAVTVEFLGSDATIVWTFGRDLLLAGRFEPTGDCDVHVFPSLDRDGHAVVVIELFSREGAALVQVGTRDLQRFVHRTVGCVPPGAETEYVDIDTALTALLQHSSMDTDPPRAGSL